MMKKAGGSLEKSANLEVRGISRLKFEISNFMNVKHFLAFSPNREFPFVVQIRQLTKQRVPISPLLIIIRDFKAFLTTT